MAQRRSHMPHQNHQIYNSRKDLDYNGISLIQFTENIREAVLTMLTNDIKQWIHNAHIRMWIYWRRRQPTTNKGLFLRIVESPALIASATLELPPSFPTPFRMHPMIHLRRLDNKRGDIVWGSISFTRNRHHGTEHHTCICHRLRFVNLIQ